MAAAAAEAPAAIPATTTLLPPLVLRLCHLGGAVSLRALPGGAAARLARTWSNIAYVVAKLRRGANVQAGTARDLLECAAVLAAAVPHIVSVVAPAVVTADVIPTLAALRTECAGLLRAAVGGGGGDGGVIVDCDNDDDPDATQAEPGASEAATAPPSRGVVGEKHPSRWVFADTGQQPVLLCADTVVNFSTRSDDVPVVLAAMKMPWRWRRRGRDGGGEGEHLHHSCS